MKKQQYINAKLFGELMDVGGQSLVGVYVMLLNGRDGYHCYTPIKNSNNKITKGKRLISKCSGVSLTALNKYLPILINMGLCNHMKNGGFFMVGQNKIREKYNSYKKVPVFIGKSLRVTKGNVNAVLIIANLYRQTKQIDKKITLNKALRKTEKGLPISKQEARMIKRFFKKHDDISKLKKVENIILSNKGFCKAITKNYSDLGQKSVSKGYYWKKVLEKRGFIVSRRRYRTLWNEQITHERFLEIKEYFNSNYGFVTYKNGRVVKPISSEILLNLPIINSNIYNTSIIINKFNFISGVESPSPSRS